LREKLGALRFQLIALAVQYKPLASLQSQVACLTAVVGSELFPHIPKGEALLNEREREREKVSLRVPL
jgi:hypothetical protein